MIIYKTTNLINGKIYVGQTNGNNKHYKGGGKIILAAIQKYGMNNFEKVTLYECETQDAADIVERYWINELNSNDPSIGYNIENGGKTAGKRTQESIDKAVASRAKNGKTEWWLGKHHTEASKKKMSEAKHGRDPHSYMTPEQIAERNRKLSLASKGRRHTDETKKKLSIAAKAYWSKKRKLDI